MYLISEIQLCDCVSFMNVCAVVMQHDFNTNGICSSGLQILVLQYYLEIKLPKMISKIIFIISKHQAGAKILVLWVSTPLLRHSARQPPRLSALLFFLSSDSACLVCFGNSFNRKDCPPLTPGKPWKLVVRALCWKVRDRVSDLGKKEGWSPSGKGVLAAMPPPSCSPLRPPLCVSASTCSAATGDSLKRLIFPWTEGKRHTILFSPRFTSTKSVKEEYSLCWPVVKLEGGKNDLFFIFNMALPLNLRYGRSSVPSFQQTWAPLK